MGNYLGYNSNNVDNRKNEHDRALLKLQVQRDRLIKYRQGLDQNQERDTRVARELLAAGRRREALLVLKRALRAIKVSVGVWLSIVLEFGSALYDPRE